MGYDYKLDPKKFVLSHARSFSLHPEFELVGGVDHDLNQCKKFESEYKRPAYKNLDNALEQLKPSVIIIATPSSSHGCLLEQVFSLHIPSVIVCEKPIDNSLEVAQHMVKLCHDNGVKLFVNYMRRSEPSVMKIKKMIDTQVIQSPLKAVVWYTKGLLNNGSHMLNLLEHWLGSVLDHNIIKADKRLSNFDPEPDFSVEFEFGSAVFCAVREDYFPHLSIEILSPSGRLYYGEGGGKIIWQPTGNKPGTSQKIFLSSELEINNDLNLYQLNFVQNLFLALNNQSHFISSGVDALETLKHINYIVRKNQK